MAAIHPVAAAASRSADASRDRDRSESSHKLPVNRRAVVAPSSDISAGFPGIDLEGDKDERVNVPEGGARDDRGHTDSYLYVDKLLEKVPQSIWQPNAVVQRHRRKATLYWLLLLLGYAVYIVLAVGDSLERRNHPPVQLTRVEESFQLPDVGFCFEGDTYGSRFGCFDGDADGKDCADSYTGDVFVYGYNHTGYTTPEGYDPSDEYIVLLPDSLSDTCRRFPLSTLTATDGDAWRFHMLMFWNSSYNVTANPGAFQSIKMYLYQGDLTTEEVIETPITLYAPISFDAQEVPFVRGFLEYEQHVSLDEHVEHTFKVVDTTTAPWYNAEDAVFLAEMYGTDSLASIQLDIRSQSFYQYAEVDPVDIVGTMGEISGFWLVVPLMFGLLFYRRESSDQEEVEMREIKICGRGRLAAAQTDFAT